LTFAPPVHPYPAALCLLGDNLLASCGADRSLRLWDLSDMKQVAAAARAHATPLHGLEYSPERQELATCSQVRLPLLREPGG
jgi:WD40 repeat protein